MDLFDLRSKVIIVLGGQGKIGLSVCESLAEIGAKVISADQSVESTELIVSEQKSSQAYWKVHCDINSKANLMLLISQVEKMFGKIDVVINCSYPRNQAYGTPLEILRSEDFCENLSIHVGGYFLVCQQFTIKFLEQGFGNIINFSSIYGSLVPRFEIYQGTTMQMPVDYSAIKAGIEHMSRYFAQKYKKNNIRVNCISPGGIYAEQDELFTNAYLQHSGNKGLLDPLDLIGGLVFLISDSSRYMTGQNIIIDDGFSL
jgi:NAD(P)-dependent dehydrogenase (short-subunit alcohol dehydrogenase family)